MAKDATFQALELHASEHDGHAHGGGDVRTMYQLIGEAVVTAYASADLS